MASNTPLTIQCSLNSNLQSQIVFESNNLIPPNDQGYFWFLVVDRADLSIVQNFSVWDNMDLPAQLNDYLDNPQYLLIFTTWRATTDNLPQGSLNNYLRNVGAGPDLGNLQQMYSALNNSTWSQFGYTLVTTMDYGSPGYEFSNYQAAATGMVNCLTLMPVPVGSGVLWTPISNS